MDQLAKACEYVKDNENSFVFGFHSPTKQPLRSFQSQYLHPVQPSKKRRPTKTSKTTRVIYDFTYEQLQKCFHMSQRDAAKYFGVAVITMKRICKRKGIRWPYREAKAHLNRLKKERQRRLPAFLHVQEHIYKNDFVPPNDRSSSGLIYESTKAAKQLRLMPFLCMAEQHENH